MDRREAIGRIAAVGVGAAGATIVSSPAFAYGVPTSVTPSVTLVKSGAKSAALTATTTVACPGSATGNTVTAQLSWSGTSGTVSGSTSGGASITATVTTTTNWAAGQTVTVILKSTATCTYASGASGTKCAQVTQVFTSSAANGAGVFNAGAPSTAPC